MTPDGGSPLRGGLIGFGAVAEKGHLPEWTRTTGVEIIGVAESDEARRAAARAFLPGARVCSAVEELFADGHLDFVDICVPSSRHAEVAGAALRNNIPVLCEKPLACRVPDAENLITLGIHSKRAVFTVHNWMFAPSIARVQELLSQDAIGTVRRCRWETIRTQPAGASAWRADAQDEGGGLLFDHGWHALYVVARWMNARPLSLTAKCSRSGHDYSCGETWDLKLIFPQGAAEIHLTWAGANRKNHAALEGTKGSLQMRDDTILVERKGAIETIPTGSAVSAGSYHPDWFGGVIRDFLHAIRPDGSGRDILRRNQEEALLCARLIEAARRSHGCDGSSVDLDHDSIATEHVAVS
ncbi:MAG: Gfo/Idh/MocA family oxidoreductase [Candidatus Hydrogenedentota bacterium]